MPRAVGTRGEGGSLNIKKRRLPRDLLIASDRHRFTIVQLILLAGVKNVSTQAFMRDYHGPMMRGVEGLTQWLLAAMMYAPASSTDFSYCTGQTFFVQSQLRLAWVQSASTPASQQSPRRVRLRSTKCLRRLVETCRVVFRGRTRLPVPTTGSEYVQLSLRLTNVIKLSFQRIGDYTGARISRAVLCCTPTVTEGWDRVVLADPRHLRGPERLLLELPRRARQRPHRSRLRQADGMRSAGADHDVALPREVMGGWLHLCAYLYV